MDDADATVHALRVDLALQIARYLERSGRTQVEMAAKLRVPQPTLSKIVNGQIGSLSVELLLRVAVRARLPVVLQTGTGPQEAGVYTAGQNTGARSHRSALGERAQDALTEGVARLSAEQRLEAQLQHSALLTELQRAAKPWTDGRRAPA